MNEVITVTVVADVDAGVADGTILTNTAQIFANNPDPNPADNSSSVGTTIAANADLQVSKTVSPSPAVPGQQVTYNIVVTNAGPADATGVILTDTLPVELGSVTVTPSQGTCDSTTGVCALGTIPAGGTATVSVVGMISASVTGTFTNSVIVTSPVADPAPANNGADAPTAVAPAADLALSLGSTPTATGGQTATVTVTVQNNGPSDATGTVITVTLPPSTTFDSGSLPVGWTAVDNGDGTVTITTTNSLEPGETVDLPMVVNVDPAVEPGTSLEFSAETTSATPDASADNNSATSDTSVIGLADLVLTKDGPTTATAGSLITYTIVVTNNGPSTSQSVDVKDQLPVGVSLDNATVTRSGTGNSACGGTVCQVGDMAVNEVITVTVVGRVNPDVADGTVLTNTATVFSDTPDPVSGNNSDPATTTISTLADIAVTKVDLTDPVGPTEQYLYEIVVTNNGPSIARSVRVTDTLDIRTTFLSASDGCALTVPGGHTVVCAVGDLGPDQSKRYLLAVRAGDVTSGTVFLNSVEATSSTADPNLANNTDTEQTTVHVNVGPTADLELVKTGSPATVVAGQRLTYTIVVTNHGPVQARQVQVLDSLPAEVTLIRATPSMGVCAGATCVLGDMAVGSSATVTVVVRVNGDVADGTTILNVALASSPTADAGNYPNYDTETTPVQAVADLFVTKSHTGAVRGRAADGLQPDRGQQRAVHRRECGGDGHPARRRHLCDRQRQLRGGQQWARRGALRPWEHPGRGTCHLPTDRGTGPGAGRQHAHQHGPGWVGHAGHQPGQQHGHGSLPADDQRRPAHHQDGHPGPRGGRSADHLYPDRGQQRTGHGPQRGRHRHHAGQRHPCQQHGQLCGQRQPDQRRPDPDLQPGGHGQWGQRQLPDPGPGGSIGPGRVQPLQHRGGGQQHARRQPGQQHGHSPHGRRRLRGHGTSARPVLTAPWWRVRPSPIPSSSPTTARPWPRMWMSRTSCLRA